MTHTHECARYSIMSNFYYLEINLVFIHMNMASVGMQILCNNSSHTHVAEKFKMHFQFSLNLKSMSRY